MFLERLKSTIRGVMLASIAALGLSQSIYAEVEISAGNNVSDNYNLAASGNYGIACWLEYSQEYSKNVQMVSLYTFDGDNITWSTPLKISESSETNFYAGKVAINSSGEAIVVWKPSTDTINAIRYDGNSWGSIENIGASKVNSYVEGNEIVVGIDDSGKILAAWRYPDSETKIASSYYNGTSWSQLTDLTAEDAKTLDFAMNHTSGTGMLVWLDSTNSGNNYFAMACQFTDGAWESAQEIKTVEDDSVEEVSVAINGSDNVIVAITGRTNIGDGNTLGFLLTRYYTEDSWQSTKTILTGSNSFQRVTLDDNNLAHLAFVDWTSGDPVLKAITLTEGENNNDPMTLSTGDNFQNVEMSTNAAGAVTIAWQNGTNEVKRATHPVGSDWETSFTPIEGVQPKVVRLSGSQEVLTFARYEDVTTLYSFYPEAIALEAPANFAGTLITDRFASQTYYTYELSWEPSPSENIAGHKLYKGETLLTTISEGQPLLYRDYKIAPSNSITYTIVAYDEDDNESDEVTLTLPN